MVECSVVEPGSLIATGHDKDPNITEARQPPTPGQYNGPKDRQDQWESQRANVQRAVVTVNRTQCPCRQDRETSNKNTD